MQRRQPQRVVFDPREFAKAWADLDEAFEIAERGSMGIHLADYHLAEG